MWARPRELPERREQPAVQAPVRASRQEPGQEQVLRREQVQELRQKNPLAPGFAH